MQQHESGQAKDNYEFKPFPGSSHSWALEQISKFPRESRILDIGCASGQIGKKLRALNFVNLYAVETAAQYRENAAPFYNKISAGFDKADEKSFDLILMLDVLEHTSEPAQFLAQSLAQAKSGAHFLISLPNVAHWSVRLPLLFGSFNYQDRGILDKTHLHFFTLKSAKKMFSETGELSLLESAHSIEPLELILPAYIYDNVVFESISKCRVQVARLLPGFFAYQNLFLLKKS